MKRRKWAPKTKAITVLEGPVAAISQDYQISQAQYYQRRDFFLTNENPRLKNLVIVIQRMRTLRPLLFRYGQKF